MDELADIEEHLNKMLERLKAKDPVFDLRIEFGTMLMRHIDDLSPIERKRYDELKEILKNNPI